MSWTLRIPKQCWIFVKYAPTDSVASNGGQKGNIENSSTVSNPSVKNWWKTFSRYFLGNSELECRDLNLPEEFGLLGQQGLKRVVFEPKEIRTVFCDVKAEQRSLYRCWKEVFGRKIPVFCEWKSFVKGEIEFSGSQKLLDGEDFTKFWKKFKKVIFVWVCVLSFWSNLKHVEEIL